MTSYEAPWFKDASIKAEELVRAFGGAYTEPAPAVISGRDLAAMICHSCSPAHSLFAAPAWPK